MNSIKNNIRIFLCIIGFLLPCLAFAVEPEDKALRILADSSLAPAMTALSREYTATTGVSLIFTFDGAAELVRRIEEGEAADAVILDHPQWLNLLKQRGLVDVYSEQPIARNRLVLALPSTSLLFSRLPEDKKIEELLPWLAGRTFMVLADPQSSSLGIYAAQVIENAKLPMLQMKRLIAANSQQAAYYTAQNNAAGLLYASDVPYQPGLKALAAIPPALYEPVYYKATAVAGENMALARQFLAFLQQERAQTVFRRHGL